MASGTVTRYDASFPAMGGGDEKALQSRRQTSQGATRQGVEAEGPQCAQGRRPSQFLRCWARNRGRAAHPRALVLVVGGGSLGALMLRKNAAGGLA
jgi:hypothetical protein